MCADRAADSRSAACGVDSVRGHDDESCHRDPADAGVSRLLNFAQAIRHHRLTSAAGKRKWKERNKGRITTNGDQQLHSDKRVVQLDIIQGRPVAPPAGRKLTNPTHEQPSAVPQVQTRHGSQTQCPFRPTWRQQERNDASATWTSRRSDRLQRRLLLDRG
jgi:hypothetical protein